MPRQQIIQSGFTLLEVMIAIFILSIGLLGLAQLQATGLKHNESAYLRTQVSNLAADMFDRMRANHLSVQNGDYLLAAADSPPITTAQLVDIDLAEWIGNVNASLPESDGEISCADSNAADGFMCSAGSIFTVTIFWNEVQDDGSRGLSQFSYSAAL